MQTKIILFLLLSIVGFLYIACSSDSNTTSSDGVEGDTIAAQTDTTANDPVITQTIDGKVKYYVSLGNADPLHNVKITQGVSPNPVQVHWSGENGEFSLTFFDDNSRRVTYEFNKKSPISHFYERTSRLEEIRIFMEDEDNDPNLTQNKVLGRVLKKQHNRPNTFFNGVLVTELNTRNNDTTQEGPGADPNGYYNIAIQNRATAQIRYDFQYKIGDETYPDHIIIDHNGAIKDSSNIQIVLSADTEPHDVVRPDG